MKSLTVILFTLVAILISPYCFAQDMLSVYKPKNKPEKLVLEKLKGLPEIEEHCALKKEGNPDVTIGKPYSGRRNYIFQVGFDLRDRFSTNYYLSIDPKTLQVYFEDFSDESGDKSITLQQWRKWRNKPGFNSPHKWVNEELVVLKGTKHDKKKSSKT